MKAIYKFPLLAILLTILLVGGCGKDDGGGPAAPEEVKPFTVTGKVKDWKYGDDKYIVFAYSNTPGDASTIFGRAKISVDGSFAVTLEKPQDQYLNKFNTACQDYLTISDTNVQIATAGIYIADASNVISWVTPRNGMDPGTSGYVRIYFLYAAKSFSVVGNSSGCDLNTDYSYSLYFKSGWNMIFAAIVDKVNSVSYLKYDTEVKLEFDYVAYDLK